MKSLYLLLVFFACAVSVYGQSSIYGRNQSSVTAGIDVGSGFENYAWAPSVLYHEEIGFHGAPWIKFGLGIRGWGYYGGRTNLYTKDERNYLEYGQVSANGISFVIGANLSFWRIDLGVNTDLAGLAFGSKRHGYYEKITTTPGTGLPYYNTWLSTSPVILNALPLVLKNRNGQSETYARIHITRKVGLKVGYLYGQIAYLTKKIKGEKVLLDNSQRRLYNTYGMPYASLSFSLSN